MIFGLGNTDTEAIKRLCAVYAKAGADIFDVSPDPAALTAFDEGIEKSGISRSDVKCCVSFSLADDVHGSKARIDAQKCQKCGRCKSVCTNDAISENFEIIAEKCIGCRKCAFCDAISYSKPRTDVCKTLKNLTKTFKIDAVELHVNGAKTSEIVDTARKIKKLFPEITVGICLTRGIVSDKESLDVVKAATDAVFPQKLYVQADGIPMSGGKNDYASNLQSLAFAQILKDTGAKIIVSGGCNAKTLEFAELSGVDIDGFAAGSFARNLIKNFLKTEDFWYNENGYDSAVKEVMRVFERE